MAEVVPSKGDSKLIDRAIEKMETLEELIIMADYFLAKFRKDMEELATRKHIQKKKLEEEHSSSSSSSSE